MKKASWITIGILSTIVGLYPIIYFLIHSRFTLLASKSVELLNDNLWNIAFYGHITMGGLSLLIGWLQFSNKLRIKKTELHRMLGKIYVISVLISGVCGLYIALNATGGIISILGFFILGLIWITTTLIGFRSIKKRNIRLQENFMIFSYAACFAAVTLRVWLPLLTTAIGEFITAYRIVAWLCWFPNLIVAFLIVRNRRQHTLKPVVNTI